MLRFRSRIEDSRLRLPVGIRRYQAFELDSEPVLQFEYHRFTALIDTGARRTCVSQNVVERVGLKRRGRVEVWNIKRPEDHWTYFFNLAFWPNFEGDETRPEPHSPFGFPYEIEGIDVGNHPYFDVLIGMDVLSHFEFKISKAGWFELRF